MIITTSLGGIKLPFSDFIGKVTPVKPKPLSPSSGDLSVSKSSLQWDGEDILQAMFSKLARGSVTRDFSAPLILTSTPRTKPNIDASSVLDRKLTDRFGKDGNTPFKFKSPVIAKCKGPVVKNTLPNNGSPLSASNRLPYPLYYKSMNLPKVRTPELKPLNNRPTSYIGGANINIPSQSQNLLRSTFISSPSNRSYVNGRRPCLPDKPVYPSLIKSTSSNLNQMKTADFSSSIPIPKIAAPLSIEPALSAKSLQIKSPTQSLQTSSTSSVAFESKFLKSKSFNPLFNTRGDENISPLLNSNPYSIADQTINSCQSAPTLSVLSPTSFNSPKMPTPSLPSKLPSVSLASPVLPQTSIFKPDFEKNACNIKPNFNVLPNCKNNFDIKTADYSKNVDAFMKLNNRKTDDLIRKFQPRIDLAEVQNLKRIDIPDKFPSPHISYYSPIMPEKCVSSMCDILPPTIPTTPYTSVSSGTSSSTFERKTPQTPILPMSYINITPSDAVSQSSSDMVSSINKIVSNISQNILSSSVSYLQSTPNNQFMTSSTETYPYASFEFKPKQTLPIQSPLPPVNEIDTASTLPILSSSISMNSLPIILPAVLPIDEPITVVSSSYETSYPQSSISLLQPITATVVPLTSLTEFSPQICPSYLPPPALPSYPIISSPFSMEPIVLKASSSKKDSKDIDKLIEVMLIAELLNDDESFDWDDLDTLLALLTIN